MLVCFLCEEKRSIKVDLFELKTNTDKELSWIQSKNLLLSPIAFTMRSYKENLNSTEEANTSWWLKDQAGLYKVPVRRLFQIPGYRLNLTSLLSLHQRAAHSLTLVRYLTNFSEVLIYLKFTFEHFPSMMSYWTEHVIADVLQLHLSGSFHNKSHETFLPK